MRFILAQNVPQLMAAQAAWPQTTLKYMYLITASLKDTFIPSYYIYGKASSPETKRQNGNSVKEKGDGRE